MFSSVNTCWTLVAAFLVYFMQAGFALCEAGFTRAKNTGNILMKNMMDFCIGTPCYWLIGFGLMFGGTGALIGGFDPFIQGDYSHLGLDIPLWVYIVFQTVFCATAATIVSGSMAERTNFKAYCVYSAAISLVVYPICGHWMWGGGWLQSIGFHDFAGSAAVHNVGGVIAMLGAALLGPRIGKYDKDGKPHACLLYTSCTRRTRRRCSWSASSGRPWQQRKRKPSHGPVPVSYTHLDVYKRQPQHYPWG